MRVLSLAWVGTRTTEYTATVAFFRDVIGLPVGATEPDFTVLEVPDGATVEVFGPASPYNRHPPIPWRASGWRTSNAPPRSCRRRGSRRATAAGGWSRSWLHFRAPDGFVDEAVEDRCG